MNEKRVLFGIIALCIVGVIAWMFWETKPKTGQQIDDLGRTHVPIGTQVEYNSNPPTSGSHYEQWTKWGVLDTPRDDRNLVHSLEHGYVIMSYNCDFRPQGLLIKDAFAQSPSVLPSGLTGQMSVASDSATATSSANMLPDSFKSSECQDLVNKLTEVFNAKGQVRLLVVPRPNLDARVALSAWRYLDKFNDFDRKRIENFISSHVNQGPEKTIE